MRQQPPCFFYCSSYSCHAKGISYCVEWEPDPPKCTSCPFCCMSAAARTHVLIGVCAGRRRMYQEAAMGTLATAGNSEALDA